MTGLHFHTAYMGKRHVFFTHIPSTNRYLKESYDGLIADGFLVTTDQQSAGYGRRGSKWQSTSSSSLLFSLALTKVSKATQITPTAALSIIKVLEQQCHIHAHIKWPNDIYIHGKKCCGILSEALPPEKAGGIILGIGLNITQSREDFPQELQNKATSLILETARRWDRRVLLHHILLTFEQYYERVKRGDFRSILPEINHRLYKKNTPIRFKGQSQAFTAKIVGIDHLGGLLLERDDTIFCRYKGKICFSQST